MSTPESIDLSDTVAPNSDQVQGDDLLPGPRTVTIKGISKRADPKQPIDIHLEEFDRPFRPCLTMRRLLMAAWGKDGKVYIGRRMTLYRDPNVKYGGEVLGGVRISHLSHIDNPISRSLTETKGKRKMYRADPLPDDEPKPTPKGPTAAGIIAAFDALGVTVEQLEKRLGLAHDGWDATDLETLAALGKAIKAGETTVYEEFPDTPPTEDAGR